jgi:predicted metal-binding membrane protein
MTYEPREFARVAKGVLWPSVIAWLVLLLQPGGMTVAAHCLSAESGAVPSSKSFQMILAMNPPASLLMGWAVMVVAMMSPVLSAPICHIRLRSFTDRRTRAVTLFVFIYLMFWMALGSILLAIKLATTVFLPQSYLPLAGVALIAVVWQFSPIKQLCLNRCHAHGQLSAFGLSADFDALRFGTTHGIWCAGSCWALMLFPMLLPRGHVASMAAVAILIFSERLEEPNHPCWRWRGLGKALRIVIAQARIRLHACRSLPSQALSASEQRIS